MKLEFLPEGEGPEATRRPPVPWVDEGDVEYLDYLRDINDEELRQRWLDVESDPALLLDWSDGGFHWTEEELAEATGLARARLYWGDDALDPYMMEEE